jgi:hypothetical protein
MLLHTPTHFILHSDLRHHWRRRHPSNQITGDDLLYRSRTVAAGLASPVERANPITKKGAERQRIPIIRDRNSPIVIYVRILENYRGLIRDQSMATKNANLEQTVPKLSDKQ